MALLPQIGKGNTNKGNLQIRKLEITTLPSVPERNNGQPWSTLELPLSTSCHFEHHFYVNVGLIPTVPLLLASSAFNVLIKDQTQLD